MWKRSIVSQKRTKMIAVLKPTESKTFSVKQGKEVVVRMKNRTGILSDIAKLVSEKG